MTAEKELLNSTYSPISVEGNKKLILDSDAFAWIVTEGTVHVFASRLNEDSDTGRRHYVSQFNKGDMLFGVKPYMDGGKAIAFLCTGITDTKLAKIDMVDFQNALEDESKANLIYVNIRKWVMVLAESTIDMLADVEWVNDITFENNSLLKELEGFNLNAVKRAALYIERVYKDEGQLLERKRSSDDSFVQDSLKKLVEVSQQGKKSQRVIKDKSELSENPVAAACQIIGQAMDIDIRIPPENILKKSKDILLDIVRYSQIRCRQVILSGEWWKADNGPFLAFFGDDNSPAALIPVTGNSYKMIDPADDSERIVKSETSLKINPKAYMLYRVLPSKKLDVADILKFCWHGSIKRDLTLVVFIGVLGGILNMFVPIANGILFDRIIPDGERGQLLQMALILGSFGISAVLFQLVRTFAMIRIEGRTDTMVQAAVWDRVLSLPAPFFRKFTAGELTMRVMGINQIRKAISGTVITTILSALFSIFNLGLLFKYSPKMAFYALVLVFISAAVTFACSFLQMRYERELLSVSNKIVGQVLQIIGGIAKFRVAGAEKRAFFQWAKAFGRQREIEFRNEAIENALITFNEIFPIITSIIIFFAAFSTKALGAGSFIAFNSAFTGFMAIMLALSGVIPVLNNIIPTYESTKPILEALPEYDEIKDDPGDLDGSIELSHVIFRYNPEAPVVINDLSLKINKGEYLAIVGASGCGKSTILRLLLGFEKPESGKIYYGAHDIDKVDIRSIRKQLGVVMQNSQLMAGDIKSNIIGANLNLSMDDAVEAAKMAGLYEDIQAMPMGMFTVISEGGSTLSGGQRQRLMIARAIASKPKIIFFDEATSALDNKTQAIVSKSMDSLKVTRIVIAHRLSTILKCDRIIVLDKGRIVEEGSYEELMNNRNMFYELAKRQLA